MSEHGNQPKPELPPHIGGGVKSYSLTTGMTDNVQPSRPQSPDERAAEQARIVDDAISNFESTEEKIVAAIKQVFDPEIPVNIHDLGLIYSVDVDDDKNVHITMTLTSPACPAAQEIPVQVRAAASRVAEVKDVEVDITFDPPWSHEMMSDVAKIELGMM